MRNRSSRRARRDRASAGCHPGAGRAPRRSKSCSRRKVLEAFHTASDIRKSMRRKRQSRQRGLQGYAFIPRDAIGRNERAAGDDQVKSIEVVDQQDAARPGIRRVGDARRRSAARRSVQSSSAICPQNPWCWRGRTGSSPCVDRAPDRRQVPDRPVAPVMGRVVVNQSYSVDLRAAIQPGDARGRDDTKAVQRHGAVVGTGHADRARGGRRRVDTVIFVAVITRGGDDDDAAQGGIVSGELVLSPSAPPWASPARD